MSARRWPLIAAATCAVFGALVGLASPSLAADDAASAPPWRTSVARFNLAGVARCSAVLIAPDQALTAAHCLAHPVSRRLLSPDRLHLLFGYHRGAWAHHARVARYDSADPEPEPGGPRARARSAASLAQDLALLHLVEPVLEAAPVPLAAPDGSGPLAAAGYGAPRAELLSIAADCVWRHGPPRKGAGLALLGCDATPGASGGGVFDRDGRLVGILVGRSSDENGPVALVVTLDGPAARALLGADAPSGAAP